MSQYQVTARKWRPQDFSQVVGQEHVTIALSNAINSGKVPHAYLFSGPRGVGKTSTARILAKLLNCAESPNVCGKCTACQEITLGQSLDVREIDGASNRGIEQIREIRDNAIYTPISLKYKVFIIDEVHMLTKEASNALLKVLEEPPSHVIFMLATTEANKVLPTIRSRCQHYLLKRIPLKTIIDRLSAILEAEGYTHENTALEEIAKAGDGSMRDSQTILDQVILYSEGNLTLKATREVLGLPEAIYFEKIIQGIAKQDIVQILEQFNTFLMEAGDGKSFGENLTAFLRQGLLLKKLPVKHPLLDMSEEKYEELGGLFDPFEEQDVLNLLNLSLELCDILRKETAERFWIESTLFKMFDYKNRISLSELRQEIFKVIGRNNTATTTNITKKTTITAQTSKQDVGNLGVFGAKLEERRQIKAERPEKTVVVKASLEELDNKKKEVEKPTPINAILEANMETDGEKIVAPREAPLPITPKPKSNQVISGDTVEDTIKNLFEIP